MIAEPNQGGTRRTTATVHPAPEYLRVKPVPSVHGRRRPMARRGGRVSRTFQDLTWRSPETFALMLAAVAAALLCFQVSLWARVTAEDFELARIKREMGKAQAEENGLRAEISNLVLPGPVAARARKLNLTDARNPNEPETRVLAPTDATLQPVYTGTGDGRVAPVSVKD